MPMYEYQCLDCGITFERFRRFSDPQVDTCPNGHSHVQRLLSVPTIIFKGSGFYATDHGRNGSSSPSTKKPREPKADTGTAAEEKTTTP
jgi:putative FmdB family regulatory protein